MEEDPKGQVEERGKTRIEKMLVRITDCFASRTGKTMAVMVMVVILMIVCASIIVVSGLIDRSRYVGTEIKESRSLESVRTAQGIVLRNLTLSEESRYRTATGEKTITGMVLAGEVESPYQDVTLNILCRVTTQDDIGLVWIQHDAGANLITPISLRWEQEGCTDFEIQEVQAIIWPPGVDKSNGLYIDDVFLGPKRFQTGSLQADVGIPGESSDDGSYPPFPTMKDSQLRQYRLDSDDVTRKYELEVMGAGGYVLSYYDFIMFQNCWLGDQSRAEESTRLYRRGEDIVTLEILDDADCHRGAVMYEITYLPGGISENGNAARQHPVDCEYDGAKDSVEISELVLEELACGDEGGESVFGKALKLSGKAENLTGDYVKVKITLKATTEYSGREHHWPDQKEVSVYIGPHQRKGFEKSWYITSGDLEVESLDIYVTAGTRKKSGEIPIEYYGSVLSPHFTGFPLPLGTTLRELDRTNDRSETLLLEVPMSPEEILEHLDNVLTDFDWRRISSDNHEPQRVYEKLCSLGQGFEELLITIELSAGWLSEEEGRTNLKAGVSAEPPEEGSQAILIQGQSILKEFGDVEPIEGVRIKHLSLVSSERSSTIYLRGLIDSDTWNDLTVNIIGNEPGGASVWRQWDRDGSDPTEEPRQRNILSVPLPEGVGRDFQIEELQVIEWPGQSCRHLYIPSEIPQVQGEPGPPIMTGQELISTETGLDGVTTQELDLPGNTEFVLDCYDTLMFQQGWRRDNNNLGQDSRRYTKGSMGFVILVTGEGDTPGYSRCRSVMGPGI